MKKAYVYRLSPTGEQVHELNRLLGACRKVYNLVLDRFITEYKEWVIKPNTPKLAINDSTASGYLSQFKQSAEYAWLYDFSAVALQQKAMDVVVAYRNFFKRPGRVGYPRFKNRFGEQTCRLMTNGFILRDDALLLAKFDQPLKVRWSRPLPSEPSQITLRKTQSGKYYVSFLCEVQPTPVTTGIGSVGIDLGIRTLAVTSDGEYIENPKYFVEGQKKIQKLQRRLSHKVKGSSNRNKARLKLARACETVANRRKDYIHKLTTELVRRYALIGIESLRPSNMAKNHRLAKHILDAGFGFFRDTLIWKVAESRHCKLVLANPFYASTQICSHCLQRSDEKLELKVVTWTCGYCGKTHDRDHNAAINLKQLAERLASCITLQPGAMYLATVDDI